MLANDLGHATPYTTIYYHILSHEIVGYPLSHDNMIGATPVRVRPWACNTMYCHILPQTII